MNIIDHGNERRAKLDAIRAKIVKATETLDAIREAPRTADEATERFLAAIADEQEVARVRMGYFRFRGQVEAPTMSAGLLALLLGPDELAKRVRAHYESLGEPGISDADRAKQAEAASKKLSKLRAEELAELDALERAGALVEFDPDAIDLTALLALWESETE